MAGTAAPSLTATLVEEALAEGTLTAEHEEDIKGAAGVVYAGEHPPRTRRPHTRANAAFSAGSETVGYPRSCG